MSNGGLHSGWITYGRNWRKTMGRQNDPDQDEECGGCAISSPKEIIMVASEECIEYLETARTCISRIHRFRLEDEVQVPPMRLSHMDKVLGEMKTITEMLIDVATPEKR
jgi:hypothetical protein